jgi:hypothetical protein
VKLAQNPSSQNLGTTGARHHTSRTQSYSLLQNLKTTKLLVIYVDVFMMWFASLKSLDASAAIQKWLFLV